MDWPDGDGKRLMVEARAGAGDRDWMGRPLVLGGVEIPTRFFLAPLAGYTGLAYRLTVRELGGLGLCTTDLVNARSILENRVRAGELTETCEADRPMAMQLYGHEEEQMAEAARRVVARGATVVDINMGCPVRKVVRSGGGSALMCDTPGAVRLVSAVIRAVAPVPVTVKMRLGWDKGTLTAPELARAFESIGVSGVIIHGRTREQGFTGLVDLGGIAAVVGAVRAMPVVGNGDIRTIQDAERMFRETGCAAISIGRGALANPFFFRELASWSRTGDAGPAATFEERLEVCIRHFHRLVRARGERTACLQFRKLLKWYDFLIRPERRLWKQLINLESVDQFERVTAAVRGAGPRVALDAVGGEPHVHVPTGPIDKW